MRFEGEIEMSVTIAASMPITWKVESKGDKTRIEAIASTTITDTAAKKMWSLQPATHSYVETDLSSLAAASAAAKAGGPKVSVKKTGRTDKVAGYDCDVYTVDDPSGALSDAELCLASGFSMLALGLGGPFSSFGSAASEEWSEILSHGFPLRVVLRDPSGAPLVKMEATHIERRSVPDSEFEIPPGYTKTLAPTFPSLTKPITR